MRYLIQGVFYQSVRGLSMDCRPVEGYCVVVHKNPEQQGFEFRGVIFPDQGLVMGGGLMGVMDDRFGTSTLSEIGMSPNLVRFTKTYNRRDDAIDYVFARTEDGWLGTYQGVAVESGVAACVITEVPDDFFAFWSINAGLERLKTSG